MGFSSPDIAQTQRLYWQWNAHSSLPGTPQGSLAAEVFVQLVGSSNNMTDLGR